jgi:alkylation response protein AidB-like acyl-CoA dehydrogenase
VDFSFTEEQLELKAEARRWLAGRWPLERDWEADWDPADWRELAALGWLGVSVGEEHGGAGLGFLEEAMLIEELGYALYPGPYVSTIALALPSLSPEQQAEVARGEKRWSAEVDGLVPDWGRVDAVVTEDGEVTPEGTALESIDPTRPLGRLEASNSLLQGLSPRGLAALACEAVGVAQRALDLAIEHARSRQQFGKPIGSYQAVAHPLADTYLETELARSLAYWAAWCVAEDDEQAPVAAAAAKAQASEAAVAACERSIQIHGGIGFTWEHPLHRYYRRAQWIEHFGDSPARLRATVAEIILPKEAAWTA